MTRIIEEAGSELSEADSGIEAFAEDLAENRADSLGQRLERHCPLSAELDRANRDSALLWPRESARNGIPAT